MDEGHNPIASGGALTRRQAIVGAAMAFGSLAVGSKVWAATQQQTANQTRTSLHQEVDLKASPQRIYEVLLDSKQFAQFTKMPAQIDPKAGGAFSLFGGLIVGRNIELVQSRRIVQAWRPINWGPGIYSMVKFELKPKASDTIVVLDHTGFPEGDFDHLYPGWPLRYWEPLKKFLA